VIDGNAGLVLPLVYHLVQQRVQRFGPAVALDVGAADRNLGGDAGCGGAVVPEAALHAARDAHLDLLELPGEVVGVVARVPVAQLRGELAVVVVHALAAGRRLGGRDDGKADDDVAAGAAVGPGAAFDECDNAAKDGFGRDEVPFVDAKLAVAEAHHHVAVSREPKARDGLEPELPQPGEELVGGGGGNGLEEEVELCVVDAATEQARQRLKHLLGPGTKLRSWSDQTSVATSICCGEMRMLFTDDGRPPRIRFDTVPAVEMTVPFFVCSM
jgi:hypothetical protein